MHGCPNSGIPLVAFFERDKMMDRLNQELFSSIVAQSHERAICEKYGETGLDHYTMMIGALKGLYSHLRFATVSEIVVFVSDSYSLESVLPLGTKRVNNFQHIAARDYQTLSIQVVSESEIVVSESIVDFNEIVEDSFVYRYNKGEEYLFVKDGESFRLPKVSGADSCFAVATFKTLDEALDTYGVNVARNAKCQYILDSMLDNTRLYFKTRPEHFLRDSLSGFLNARLRDVEVRIEQNVDETHPVDIKVVWMYTNKQALIEVKWLGASVDPSNKTKVKTYYDHKRAHEGAVQLADYLDWNRSSVPLFDALGYLVVFDLRREGCKKNVVDTISMEDAFAYEGEEIIYDPNYHLMRRDFAMPRRFFIAPNIR